MDLLNSNRMILTVVVVVAAIVIGEGNAKADFTFGEPTNLGVKINTERTDWTPCLSENGLELYYTSYSRNGGYGSGDIWMSVRPTVSDEWGQPENLGQGINTPADEACPSVSVDGLTLYFTRGLSESGTYDLWVTKRITRNDPWGEPEKLASPVNSEDDELLPNISRDGLELYFISGHWIAAEYGESQLNIKVAKRESENASWETPIDLGPTVNSWSCQFTPRISNDGLVLFFSDFWNSPPRPDGFGGIDMWLTRRATKDGQWSEPVNLGSQVNTVFHEDSAIVSADGSMLYFVSDRCGGSGGWDIWQAPILPIVDFDGDLNVGLNDLTLLIESWDTDNSLCDVGPMPWGDGVVDELDLEVLMNHWGESYPVNSFVVVDDFESYSDDKDGGRTIFHTWLDGFGHGEILYPEPAPAYGGNGTGSTVGNVTPPHSEQTIVREGCQSMPLWYDNDGAIFEGTEWELKDLPFYSEAQRTWDEPQDWTVKGVELLTLWIHGDQGNAPSRGQAEPLYIILQDSTGNETTITHPDPNAILKDIWKKWSIPLTDFTGVDLTSIKKMSIGVGDKESTTPGGSGVVFIDGIKLLPPEVSEDPDTKLAAHWKLDESEGTTAYDSISTNYATLFGDPIWQPNDGVIDGALALDGTDDYISIPFILHPRFDSFSLFAWIKVDANKVQNIFSQKNIDNLLYTNLSGKLVTSSWASDVRKFIMSQETITLGQWHHVGLVFDGRLKSIYLDGVEVAQATVLDAPAGYFYGDTGLHIGASWSVQTDFFSGLIDDVRLYNAALNVEDIEALIQ